MNIRDKLNSYDNYKFIINFKKNAINQRKTKLTELPYHEDNIEITNSIRETINNYQDDIMIATYSIGYSIPQFKEAFLDSLTYMQSAWKKSNGYEQMVRMLSIAILLDIDQHHFNQLIELVQKDNPNDYLIDTLIHYHHKNWPIHPDFMFSRPYALTKEIIELASIDKTKSLNKLKNYLQKRWYSGHRDSGWYNSHKSQHNIHSGYWSFESGALVKILGLDDTSLKDQQYYPYDLVHYADNQ
ncbi:PoNi-like cognate immunity protein [Pasteurella testudinis]|uniref:PoNi-like cognate immunity protein n=1 Tax=Pasteurella testudinis TaxID=761 RepID=UPI000E06AAA9|nr:PoNi-like cognate immunity protein [Pasteurella testudinis]SUB52190.1 Domain of uncharacterised function (DUF1911) [Pasteurella testudinis]